MNVSLALDSKRQQIKELNQHIQSAKECLELANRLTSESDREQAINQINASIDQATESLYERTVELWELQDAAACYDR